jgi:F0F1-type ATP synthase delta subunit
MQIVEPDFTMKLSDETSDKFDLTFNKRVKKRDTGKYEIEPGDTLYGLTLVHCLERIAKHRTAKKWQDENITLKEFLKEYQIQHKELVKLCRETLPEKFDTGE